MFMRMFMRMFMFMCMCMWVLWQAGMGDSSVCERVRAGTGVAKGRSGAVCRQDLASRPLTYGREGRHAHDPHDHLEGRLDARLGG